MKFIWKFSQFLYEEIKQKTRVSINGENWSLVIENYLMIHLSKFKMSEFAWFFLVCPLCSHLIRKNCFAVSVDIVTLLHFYFIFHRSERLDKIDPDLTYINNISNENLHTHSNATSFIVLDNKEREHKQQLQQQQQQRQGSENYLLHCVYDLV